MAQKWGPGELSDYNETVDETAEERAKRLEHHHSHECVECGRIWDCDGADCGKPLDFFTICDGCEFQKEG